ncbi:N-acetylmuramoyl-L-alanine amidase [Heliobacterium mobile]|nr:N-acetylmuramoyl-L-alanine amidase [Heliobacterium mobile]
MVKELKKWVLTILLLGLFVTPCQAKSLDIVLAGKVLQPDVPPMIVSGRTLVPLRIISENLGATVDWSSKKQSAIIAKDNVHIEVKIGSKEVLVNGTAKQIDVPARIVNNRTMVPLRVVAEMLNCPVFFDAQDYQVIVGKSRNTPYKVMIDAGHGGYDTGAIGHSGVNEKDVVLAIAKIVQNRLSADHINVAVTRSSDIFVGLQERVDASQTYQPDIFVSIHANSSDNAEAKGTETFYRYDTFRSLAQTIQSTVIDRTQLTDRGVKRGNLWVLCRDDLPSVLVETAFISNPTEEKLLRSPAYQQKVADGIIVGIEKYLTSSM